MDHAKYKRRLPHYHPLETPLFVTFRLHNSIPEIVRKCLLEEFEIKKEEILKMPISHVEKKEMFYEEQKRYYGRMENYLHHSSKDEKWLAIPEIGKLVHDKIISYDKDRYNLICSNVMPNHAHILFEHYELNTPESNQQGKDKDYPVSQTMRYIKGATARNANIILGRKGAFWQDESYDHYIRNDKELDNVINYILNNPVKAGLVKDWTEWPWTYFAG